MSIEEIIDEISLMDDDRKIARINEIKLMLHEISPFKDEPVDCVIWVKNEHVVANDYNPNKVAPPEMQLLCVSIDNDGYTQPIVTFPNNGRNEVIDGFHRSRVGKEDKKINERVRGYLPIVSIRKDNEGKSERIASTIRHNRARGKHQIDAMSEIIIELKNRNWANSRIAKELGMDEDEILRLCQITGLESLFSDKDFSLAWEAGDSIHDYEYFDDDIDDDVIAATRTTNTSDQTRIFHTFDKWECQKAGLYKQSVEGLSKEECEIKYAEFLRDLNLFKETAEEVVKEWKHSSEHYLTNKSMNRIAWIGQAAMCYKTGIPSKFCGGFNLLTPEEQDAANEVALVILNDWLDAHNLEQLSISEALSEGRQVEIY